MCDTVQNKGNRGVTRGGKRGTIPRPPRQYGAPNHCGGRKSPKNVISTFFNTVNLLPRKLWFEHGGAKLASCPGRRLTSLRPMKGKQ